MRRNLVYLFQQRAKHLLAEETTPYGMTNVWSDDEDLSDIYCKGTIHKVDTRRYRYVGGGVWVLKKDLEDKDHDV